MSEEKLVAPVATTENPAAETVAQNAPTDAVSPAPADGTQSPETPQTPETSETQEKDARDERDKAIARMERRINRKHAEAAEAKALAAQAEERAMRLEEQLRQHASGAEKIEVDPEEFQAHVQRAANELASVKAFTEACNAIAEKGKKQFSDFEDAVMAVQKELPLFKANGFPTPAMEAILAMDNQHALLYHLGTNPDIAEDLVDLPPAKLSYRLFKIHEDLTKPERQVSKAPRPLDPVKASAAPAIPDVNTNPAAWREWRNKTARR